MRKQSRRHKENLTRTRNKTYLNIEEAIEAFKETATTKFVESVELHAIINSIPRLLL